MEQDVRWIIRKEEVAAFKVLANDEERDQFIDQFWAIRNPHPDKLENEFKIEHYRRMLYSKEHFSEGNTPGWATDRGRVYVEWGPPSVVRSKTALENGLNRDAELWDYPATANHPASEIKFVDSCSCSQYKLSDTNLLTLDKEPQPSTGGSGQIEVINVIRSQPQLKFKELFSLIDHRVNVKMIPLELNETHIPITDATDIVQLQISAECKKKEGEQDTPDCTSVRYVGRVISITGRVVETFEGSGACSETSTSNAYHCSIVREMPLRKGIFRVEIGMSDARENRAGTIVKTLRIF